MRTRAPIVLLLLLGCDLVDEPGEWCTVPPTVDQGLDDVPALGVELLAGGLTIDPSLVTCPSDFEQWVPFVRRHTSGYTSDPRFAGFDDDCVPRIDLEGRYGGIGVTQTPLVVANYGLLRYGDLVRGFTPDEIPEPCRDPTAAVLAQATRLQELAHVRTEGGVEHWAFPYDFPNLQGELEAPWTSGYAQGIAAPAFVAAYCVSNDEAWLEAAEKTLANMVVRMADGGVATWTGPAALWFEEAAAVGARSARSLNGHLGAVAGVHATAQWTGSAGVARLRDAAFDAALPELERYDAGFISLYTQWSLDHPLIAPALDYNRFHVQQLSWLHELTADPRALDMALRFARYDDPMWTWSSPSGGALDFVHNAVYDAEWRAATPAVLEVDLGREQQVSGVVLWASEPALRPDEATVDWSVDGSAWTTTSHDWTEGCNDLVTNEAPTAARYGRLTLDGPHTVALRGIGVVRERGHPTAVAGWLVHGANNRPAQALTDEGWVWSRISSALFDLDGAFEDGLTVTLTGWRGEGAPTLTRSSSLEEPFEPVGVEPTLADGVLTWRWDAARFEYLRLQIDTPSNPGADGRLFVGP